MAFEPKNPDPIAVGESLLPDLKWAWPGLTPPQAPTLEAQALRESGVTVYMPLDDCALGANINLLVGSGSTISARYPSNGVRPVPGPLPGRGLGATAFEGNWITASNIATFPGSCYTITAWVQARPHNVDRYIYKGIGSGNTALTICASGTLELKVTGLTTRVVARSRAKIDDGQWHHVAVANTGRALPFADTIYVDGREETISNLTNSAPGGNFWQGANMTFGGADVDLDPARPGVNIALAHVLISQERIPGDRIKLLYEASLRSSVPHHLGLGEISVRPGPQTRFDSFVFPASNVPRYLEPQTLFASIISTQSGQSGGTGLIPVGPLLGSIAASYAAPSPGSVVTASSRMWGQYLTITAADRVYREVRGYGLSDESVLVGAPTPLPQGWSSQLAVVRDPSGASTVGSAYMAVYENGFMAASANQFSLDTGSWTWPSTGAQGVLQDYVNVNTQYRVLGAYWFDRVLTRAEVNQVGRYANALTPMYTGSLVVQFAGYRDGLPPVALWRLNEADPRTFSAIGSLGAHAFVANSDVVLVGHAGRVHPVDRQPAAYFVSGNSANLVILNSSFNNTSSGFSVSLWAKTDVAVGGGLIAGLSAATSGTVGFAMAIATGLVSVYGRGGTVIALAAAPDDDDWHHYAVRYQNASGSTLLIDGQIASFLTNPATVGQVHSLAIGVAPVAGAPLGFVGYMQDVAIFNYTLSVAGLQAVYDASRPQ